MSAGPIMVVDDEVTNLAALREILCSEHRMVFARNGEEALAAARRHRPALALLDIRMPDMDGYALCARLKSEPATCNIPILFVTSLSDALDEAAGFACGAVDFISKPLSPVVVRARVRTHLSLVRAARLEASYEDAVFMLGEAGHFRDCDTGVHIWRMASYARILAAACGWDSEACRLIELAAPMHDTGKLGVPDAILRKPGPLDAHEWAIMRTHPRIGHDILSRSDAPVFRLAAEIALRHHEKWDGSGYPDRLAGSAIPESARIVAVADVFDALSMKRPYKEALSLDDTLEIIQQGSGAHFEPRLIEAFHACLPEILEARSRWEAQEAAA